MQHLSFVDVDYCRFENLGFKKPTRFYGGNNIKELQNVSVTSNIVLLWTGPVNQPRISLSGIAPEWAGPLAGSSRRRPATYPLGLLNM